MGQTQQEAVAAGMHSAQNAKLATAGTVIKRAHLGAVAALDFYAVLLLPAARCAAARAAGLHQGE